MKIRIKLLALLLVIISSCKKESITSPAEEDLSVSSVPEKIVNYVDDNYPDAYIESASRLSNCDAKTIVTLNTTEELAFNASDNYMGQGSQFHPPHGNGNGHGHGHGHQNGNGHGHQHGIPVDSLPAAITGYVSTNYAGYQIMHAERDSLCSAGAVIQLFIGNGTPPPVKLIFDLAGNFLMTASRTEYSTLPAAVQASITANYPGYNPRQRSEKFTLLGGQIQYAVFLFNGNVHKRVLAADDGTIICEQ